MTQPFLEPHLDGFDAMRRAAKAIEDAARAKTQDEDGQGGLTMSHQAGDRVRHTHQQLLGTVQAVQADGLIDILWDDGRHYAVLSSDLPPLEGWPEASSENLPASEAPSGEDLSDAAPAPVPAYRPPRRTTGVGARRRRPSS